MKTITEVNFLVKSENDQLVICVRVKESVVIFPIIKLLPGREMYNHGLERNFKKLVDMDEIAKSMRTLLESHCAASTLTKHRYENTIECFNKFLEGNLTYESLSSRLESTIDTTGWDYY